MNNNNIRAGFKAVVPVMYTEFGLQNLLVAARRDLYIQAGALYNDTLEPIKRITFWGEEIEHLPGHYYLNGLGDITEEEMNLIYQNKDLAWNLFSRRTNILRNSKLRTIFPMTDAKINARFNYDGESMLYNSDIEVLNVANGDKVSVFWPADFAWATKLVAVKDILDLSDFHYNFMHTEGLINLKYIMLYNAGFNIELKDSPLLLKECLLYAIENANSSADSNFAITVHPEVYAKCVEGGEWNEDVIAALIEKNQQMVNGGSINITSA